MWGDKRQPDKPGRCALTLVPNSRALRLEAAINMSRDRGRGGYGREDSRDRDRDRGRDSGVPGKVSLLVRNLTFRTRVDDVKRLFTDFGDVRDVYLPLDFGTQ